MLLTLKQPGVFFAQRGPVLLRGKEAQPIQQLFTNDAQGFGGGGELQMQQRLPGELIQRHGFQTIREALLLQMGEQTTGLALFSQWQRNASASADDSGSASKANNRWLLRSPTC